MILFIIILNKAGQVRLQKVYDHDLNEILNSPGNELLTLLHKTQLSKTDDTEKSEST